MEHWQRMVAVRGCSYRECSFKLRSSLTLQLAVAQHSGLKLSGEANRQIEEIKQYTTKLFSAIFMQIDVSLENA